MTTTNPFHQDLADVSDEDLLDQIEQATQTVDDLFDLFKQDDVKTRLAKIVETPEYQRHLHLEDEANLRGLYDDI